MHQCVSDGVLSSATNQQRIKEIFICTNQFCSSPANFEHLLNLWF